MPNPVRAALGCAGFLTGWFVSHWFLLSRFDDAGQSFLARGAPLLVGLGLAVYLLISTGRQRHGFVSAAVLGISAMGSTGFTAGFIGIPLVALMLGYDPTMAPLWGFILGPLGLLLGGPIGAFLWWRSRVRRSTPSPAPP